MKNSLKYLLALLLLSPGLTGLAQIDRTKVPAAGAAPTIRLGQAQSFVLPNGLKVFVVTNAKLPRVALSLVLDYTPIAEGEAAGYLDLAGQLLKTGTTTRSKAQLDEEIDFIGASLATSASGVYGASLKKHTPKLLELMADVMLNPAFKEEELEKLRKQTLSGLAQAKNSPDAIASNVANVLVYGPQHPYGEITTEATVNQVNLAKIKSFYQAYYRPNIGYLAVVGDITLKEAQKLIPQYLGKWTKGEVPVNNYRPVSRPEKTRLALVDRPTSVQSVVTITHAVDLKPGHPDAIKVRVMNALLGGGGAARLYNNLREKHGYTYGAYSSLSSDPLVGEFNASASVRNEVTDSAITEFFNEFYRIRDAKPEADELAKTKAEVTGSFVRSLQDPQTVANFAITTARYGLPADYYATYLQKVAAVTPDDILTIAKKYLSPDNAHLLVVGAASQVAPKLARFGEITYYNEEGKKVTPNTSKAAPTGLTADQVLEKYITASGGRKALEAVKDITMNMKAELQGMTLTGTQRQKAPNKYNFSIGIGTMSIMSTTSDGQKASMVAQGSAMPLDAKMQESMVIGGTLFPELRYEQLGVKRTLAGVETVNGKEAYRLDFVTPAGNKYTEYFEVATGLKLQNTSVTSTPQGEQVNRTDLADYKTVNGISLPYSITFYQGPMPIKFTVQTIDINKGIADDVFLVK